MEWILKNIWLLLLLVWGIPFAYFRSKFRKTVYQTNSWWINVKPVFVLELKALFGNMFPDDQSYKRLRNFYRFYLVVYLSLFTGYMTLADNKNDDMKTVTIGSKLPSFKLQNQDGTWIDMQNEIGKSNLIIYFYPKNDTPGCTKEACTFRDQFEVFADLGAKIFGISGQSIESHKKFATKHRLNFTLLSDKGNKVRKLFGVPTNFLGLIPGRVTYIVDKTGTVVHVFNSQTNAEKHVEESLRILEGMEE
jgi:peroxiredoxin Q/BCP